MKPDKTAQSLWRPMTEDEILTRAREAWIRVHNLGPWRARRARAGRYNRRLAAAILALRDTTRPMSLILADRAEATTAIALRITPGVTDENTQVVASAILAALRMESAH